MKSFDIEEAIQILETTPNVLTAFLSNVPATWVDVNEGKGTWSPFDILGHLVHGEKTDWVARTRIILEEGESKTFQPFDRFAQFEESKGKSLATLLEEFEALREKNIQYLKGQTLTVSDYEKTGIHPDFGEVTLKQLLSAWVVHDLSHIRQIARVLAKQYKTEIGPWEQYLPVVYE